MKVSALALLVVTALSTTTPDGVVVAWSTPPQSVAESRRRKMIQQGFVAVLVGATTATTAASSPAVAGLLDDYGSDPSKIQQAPAAATATDVGVKKAESAIEPNLRSNYYYPTNKKRYLPRIKRCSDAIPEVADSIGQADWEAIETFAVKIADDVRDQANPCVRVCVCVV